MAIYLIDLNHYGNTLGVVIF